MALHGAACETTTWQLAVARDLSPNAAESAAVACALARLLERLAACISLRACSFYWVMISLFFGQGPQHIVFGEPATKLLDAWSDLTANATLRLQSLRGKDMSKIRAKGFHLAGHDVGPPSHAADATSTMLLFADSPSHFEAPRVAPFVHQLRCYAHAQGMGFVMDSGGARVDDLHLRTIDISIQQEFFVSAREASSAEAAEAAELVENLLFGHLELAGRLRSLETKLAVNYASPLHFGRAWAMSEQLAPMEPGALLIYFDSDVTIRPDSWRVGLAERLVQLHKGPSLPHVFIADTWVGTDCVNSGFIAVRNTPLGRLFLELWKEKLWWSSSWDQAALGETVLELVGLEVKKLSAGKRVYDHHCLRFLLPYQKMYMFGKYCDCWQARLEHLAGPYRRRQSRVVGFVDPEKLEVNFLPNNLFHDHQYQLERMHLDPRASKHFWTPLVIHWAGLPRFRVDFMEELFEAFNFTIAEDGCARASPADEHKQVGFNMAPLRFGTFARQKRCCDNMASYTDKSAWPWSEEDGGWKAVQWWGCQEWMPLIERDCYRLFDTHFPSSNA
eukprot:TRINITY_DN109460_c0_g1_i1.p1 TRINITY_DN109460_c0_g1~~TRINITY_DN109460_c0_g1_i1.p1  ORF type:complete len:560 (-),score=84.98 TRINITY_DN109460_c0_g1_i1:25-1704(-)